MASTVLELLTSMAIIMQSENSGEIHKQVLNEPSRSQTQLAACNSMEQTVNNIENYNYIISKVDVPIMSQPVLWIIKIN